MRPINWRKVSVCHITPSQIGNKVFAFPGSHPLYAGLKPWDFASSLFVFIPQAVRGCRMITIATLRAAGLTETQILRVVEIEQSERRAERREQNRIHQQNHRARKHVSADAPDRADMPLSLTTLPSSVATLEKQERSEIVALEREFAEIFWPAYPHKVARPAALKAPTRLTDADIVVGEGRQIVFVAPDDVPALDLATSSRELLPRLLASDEYAALLASHAG